MDMTTIAFSDSARDRRTETGEIQGDGPWTLVTSHLNRPNFRVEMDGSVTLLAANADIEVEGFGELLI